VHLIIIWTGLLPLLRTGLRMNVARFPWQGSVPRHSGCDRRRDVCGSGWIVDECDSRTQNSCTCSMTSEWFHRSAVCSYSTFPRSGSRVTVLLSLACQTAARIPRPCTQRSHRAARSPPEASRAPSRSPTFSVVACHWRVAATTARIMPSLLLMMYNSPAVSIPSRISDRPPGTRSAPGRCSALPPRA
jgi:hypothetical protein